ncbi:MAG TPA: hydroxymyristoyl-ACP dehydratase [Treponema sp.]|nr:hydroxymyristoyl-ACP dehydratase [Treponema sp.]
MSENLHKIENEEILSRTEDSVELRFCIPASSDFFDGHFPEFKLLPAVAQFECVTRFAKKYLGTQRYVPRIHRIKFSAPVRPDTTVQLKLELNKEKHTVSYSLWDAKKSEKVYSSGTFTAAIEENQVV